MKVLITGGNGLVGRFVVAELARPVADGQPHSVTVLDRVRADSVPEAVNQVVGDYLERERLLEVMEGADAVLHLAALQPAAAAEEDVYGNNVQGTLNVFEAAEQCGVGVVVNWSSVWALGWSTPGNTFVPDYLPIDEAHPLRATDPYGRAKIEGEAIASSFHGRSGMRVITLRAVYTATPRGMERLWGARNRTPVYSHLSYVDARDHARAARLALASASSDYVTAYLAADDSRIAEPLATALPRLNPDLADIAAPLSGPQSAISNNHAADALGWRPQHSWRTLSMAAKARGSAATAASRAIRTISPQATARLRRYMGKRR